MRRPCLLFVPVSLLCAGALFAQGGHVVEPNDLVSLKHVSDPQISPNGASIAYVVSTAVPGSERSKSHIWLLASDGNGAERSFLAGAGSDSSPRWSPDGNSLAFLSDRQNPVVGDTSFHFSLLGVEGRGDLAPLEKRTPTETEPNPKPDTQIWMIPLHGGEAVPLTAIRGGVKSFKWSPDGTRLAFVRKDQDTKEEEERKQRKKDEIEVDKNYKFDRLWVYEIRTQQARLVTQADMNIDDFDWSPDGGRFLARVSPTPRIDDYWRVSTVVVLNSSTGAVEKTLLNHAAPMQVRWSPDGRRAAIAKLSPKAITSVPILYDVETGAQTIVGESYPATIEAMEWDADARTLTASAVEGTSAVFLSVDAKSGSVQRLAASTGPSEHFTVSRDGQAIGYVGENPEHPAEVYVRSRGKEAMLTNTNPQVKTWKLGRTEELSWKSSKDGTAVHGVLLLPTDYKKGKRYKTVVHVHGGPEEAWTAGFHGSWYDWGAVLASHGYAVLLPNPRGSDGAGVAFTEANYRDWGVGDLQDILDGVDLLIARGIADPDRLAIGGWSFGGFMTSWAVTHTDRFKAAVVGAAVTDLFTMATTTDIAPSYLNSYYGDLAGNRNLYDEHSPVRFVDRCHTPTLVMHGEADVRVPISQGEEFYIALRLLERPVEMIRYPREPHIFHEMEHQRDSLERMLKWYETYLGR